MPDLNPSEVVLLTVALARDYSTAKPSGDHAWIRAPAVRVIDCVLSLNRRYDGFITPQGTTLCTDGSGALRMAARALQVKHVALVTKRNERKHGIYHVQTVNSYQGRLKEWMAPFRGVATKYLNRYLTWHIIHERVQRLTPEQARSVLVGNTAELMLDRCCPNCGAALNA
jgi:hypothetical protein